MHIIGAGMAGLLAANMLRRYQPTILEALPELPDNHGALLRFRSNAVAEAAGVQFREVSVTKAICYCGSIVPPSLALDNLYSLKVTGSVMPRSIMNLDPAQRWIAPDNFLEILAGQRVDGTIVNLKLGASVDGERLHSLIEEGRPIISTIPMGILMSMVPDWENRVPEFPHVPIWSVRTRILSPSVNVYQTLYFPGGEPFYRASITGNLLTVEYLLDPSPDKGQEPDPDMINEILALFGIWDMAEFSPIQIRHQKYGKILPLDDDRLRREFILEMTDLYRIYSLGRFATWRQILLDDVVKDIRQIDRWITERDSYNRRRIGR